MSALGHPSPLMPPDPKHALQASGNLRRRQAVNRVFVGGTITAAALAVTVLGILVFYAADHGISQISWSFLTGDLPGYDGVGGGIGPALAGTAEMVAIATLIALPVGLLTAIYLSEFASSRPGAVVRTAVEQMAALPTIIIGVFIAGLIVKHFGQSEIAGGVALSIVEVPLIARASLESLRRVPDSMREAADALGVAHWRRVLGVTLPTASGGILTATILAVARAAGAASIPVEVLNLLNSGYPAAINKAWGAAFFMIVVILALNIAARLFLRRSERKRGL
jgi:phosphate transport system permease protein